MNIAQGYAVTAGVEDVCNTLKEKYCDVVVQNKQNTTRYHMIEKDMKWYTSVLPHIRDMILSYSNARRAGQNKRDITMRHSIKESTIDAITQGAPDPAFRDALDRMRAERKFAKRALDIKSELE